MADRSVVIKVLVGEEGKKLGTPKTGLIELAPSTPEKGHVALWHIRVSDTDIVNVVAAIESGITLLTTGQAS